MELTDGNGREHATHQTECGLDDAADKTENAAQKPAEQSAARLRGRLLVLDDHIDGTAAGQATQLGGELRRVCGEQCSQQQRGGTYFCANHSSFPVLAV